MTNPALGVEEGCWSLSQISPSEGRQGTSWTRHQFIGGPTQRNESKHPKFLRTVGGERDVFILHRRALVRLNAATHPQRPHTDCAGRRPPLGNSEALGNAATSSVLSQRFHQNTFILLTYLFQTGSEVFTRDKAAPPPPQRSVAPVTWERSGGVSPG